MDSTSNRPPFVDASVAVKWHLQVEPWTQQAEAVLTSYRNGRIELVAPGCIRYEVPSAIRKTLRTRRLTPDLARASIQAFLDLHLPTFDGDDLILAAYEITLRIGCSLDDGSYLASPKGSIARLSMPIAIYRTQLERMRFRRLGLTTGRPSAPWAAAPPA